MKFLFIAILISATVHAQAELPKGVKISDPYLNFTSDNKKVVWQKTFEASFTEEEIKEIVKKDLVLTNLASTLEGFTTEFNLISCPQSGIMPPYVYCTWSAYAKIEVKENKYRVTVSDIKFNVCADMRNTGYDPTRGMHQIEWYQITDTGEFSRSRQSNKGLNCLDQSFLQMFAFKKSTPSKSW